MSSFWARWRSCLRGLDSAKTLQTNPINRRNDGQMECGRERIRLTSGESAEMMEDHQVKDHEGPKPNEDSHPANVGWVPRFQNYVGHGVNSDDLTNQSWVVVAIIRIHPMSNIVLKPWY